MDSYEDYLEEQYSPTNVTQDLVKSFKMKQKKEAAERKVNGVYGADGFKSSIPGGKSIDFDFLLNIDSILNLWFEKRHEICACALRVCWRAVARVCVWRTSRSNCRAPPSIALLCCALFLHVSSRLAEFGFLVHLHAVRLTASTWAPSEGCTTSLAGEASWVPDCVVKVLDRPCLALQIRHV